MTASRFLIVNKIENDFDQLIVDDLQKATDSPLRLLSEGKNLPCSLENGEWNRNHVEAFENRTIEEFELLS